MRRSVVPRRRNPLLAEDLSLAARELLLDPPDRFPVGGVAWESSRLERGLQEPEQVGCLHSHGLKRLLEFPKPGFNGWAAEFFGETRRCRRIRPHHRHEWFDLGDECFRVHAGVQPLAVFLTSGPDRFETL